MICRLLRLNPRPPSVSTCTGTAVSRMYAVLWFMHKAKTTILPKPSRKKRKKICVTSPTNHLILVPQLLHRAAKENSTLVARSAYNVVDLFSNKNA
ncbi:hypothetical protein MTO96_015807 [Rhipicephalus appendiculatus]